MRRQQNEDRRIAIDFFNSDGVDKLFVFQAALQPEVQLMSAMLSANEVDWELQQLQDLLLRGSRSYHLVDVYKACQPGGRIRDFLQNCASRLHEQRFWMQSPRSEQFASFIYRIFSRAAAVAYQLLVLRCQGFPARLFTVLVNPEEAEIIIQLYQSNPCLFDPWSKDFVAKYNTAELLLSHESCMVLAAVAMNCSTNTFDTERAHTKNATKSKYRVTHPVALADLAIWPMSQTCPSWLEARSRSPPKPNTCPRLKTVKKGL